MRKNYLSPDHACKDIANIEKKKHLYMHCILRGNYNTIKLYNLQGRLLHYSQNANLYNTLQKYPPILTAFPINNVYDITQNINCVV